MQTLHRRAVWARIDWGASFAPEDVTCALAAGLVDPAQPRHVTCEHTAKMENVIENLVALQELQLQNSKPTAKSAVQMEELRSRIPESLLRNFDRFVARRRKAVATVRHGVCGECHLQIATGILASLSFGREVRQCGNCGRFLHLAEAEPVGAPETSPKAGRVR